ncbi:hypothetical protein [Thauera sp.]|jgi:hypothetical protein|nr:hypothetical protein [Thauera sp.]MDX9886550.1 hypothetical protein [Thauera sp.]
MPESNTAKRLTLPKAGQGAPSSPAKALWGSAASLFGLEPAAN